MPIAVERGRVRRRGSIVIVVAVVASVLAAAATMPATATAAETPCHAMSLRGAQQGHSASAPPPAPALFPKDFPIVRDCEWGFRVGGWGGTKAGAPIKHVPIIFVHGNHSDAVDWFGVADQAKTDLGYNDQELFAISYNGLGGQVDGAPIICPCPPSPRAVAYEQRPDVAGNLATAGQYAANEVNVQDLYDFIHAVQRYTGSKRVEIVGHSLGVTIIRKTMFLHRELFRDVTAVVFIAGGNHGTTLCRGSESLVYGCDEIGINTPWLRELNSLGTPGPTKYMTVYNGTNDLDPFFDQGPTFDDRQSPSLAGAINLMFGDAYHSDLRVRPDIVTRYLDFLEANGHLQGRNHP